MAKGLVWFRTDLRLDDNPALNAALRNYEDVARANRKASKIAKNCGTIGAEGLYNLVLWIWRFRFRWDSLNPYSTSSRTRCAACNRARATFLNAILVRRR